MLASEFQKLRPKDRILVNDAGIQKEAVIESIGPYALIIEPSNIITYDYLTFFKDEVICKIES